MPVTEEAVLSFVRGSIRSAWTLELLLLLRREPERRWTFDALVRELRASSASITQSLKSLHAAGVVALIGDEACMYQADRPELDELASALMELYEHKPITVLRTIFTSPNDRIRSFSNAFLFRRSDKT